MGKLICLLGKSGAGKDTLFKWILRELPSLSPVVPYTTRPCRANESDGVQYHFVTLEQMEQLEELGKIAEKREYATINGIWHYFTVTFDLLSTPLHHLMITTPAALDKLSQHFGSDNIVVIYLDVSGKNRLERSIKRENRENNPNFSEVCRRFLADEQDFSQANFTGFKHFFSVDANEDIASSTSKICAIINGL